MLLKLQQHAGSLVNRLVIKPHVLSETCPIVGTIPHQRRLLSSLLTQRCPASNDNKSCTSLHKTRCLHSTLPTAVGVDNISPNIVQCSNASEFVPDIPSHVIGPSLDLLSQTDLNKLEDVFGNAEQAAAATESLASLGLCSNVTPVGWTQQALEALHVHMDLPWWGAIVCCTILFRSLIFPLHLKGMKATMSAQAGQPEMSALQQRMMAAHNMQNNKAEMDKLMAEYEQAIKKHGNPLKALVAPLIQMPLFVSFFLAIRKMVDAPVESFSTGGVLWFPDLLVPDPLHVLPFVCASTMLASFELSIADTPALTPQAQQQQKFMKNLFRGMCCVMIPITWTFPAGVVAYWATSNFFTLFQGIILRHPPIRQKLGLTSAASKGTEVPPAATEKSSKKTSDSPTKTADSAPVKMSFMDEFRIGFERAKERKLQELQELEKRKRRELEELKDTPQVERNKKLFSENKRKEKVRK